MTTPSPEWTNTALTDHYINEARRLRSEALKTMVVSGSAKLRALFQRSATRHPISTDTAAA